jgi:hypothetical protein
MKLSPFVWRQSALVSVMVLTLSACGGGSSKSDSGNLPGVSSSSSSSLQTSSSSTSSITSSSLGSTSSATSSVSITSSSSSSSSVVSAITSAKISGVVEVRDSDGNTLDIANPDTVKVNVSLLGSDDQVIASETLPLLESPLQLGDSLPFTGELHGENARYLVINISSPGYTDFARRFDVQEQLDVRASLTQLPVATIPASQKTTISGAVVQGFNFSVDADGAPANAGGQSGVPELTVSIPQSALPSGTTSVDVKMQAFNPNDPAEAEYFPGAYQDSAGNKLLSVAFNYTDITTNSGTSLKKLAQKTRALRQKTAAAIQAEVAEPVIINRKVPAESCSALKQMGDSSTSIAGFQVPVYTYNPESGLWDLLGQGTLYRGDGTAVPSGFTAFDCSGTEYVVEIKVTNDIFLSNWWNLDYPLVFNQPVKLCAYVQLQDEAGAPFAGSYVYAYDDDDQRSFSAESFITDDQGNVHIELYALDGSATDTSAELRLYNKNLLTTSHVPLTLSTTCNAQQPVVIKTTVPSMCKIEGKVLDSDNKAVNKTIVFATDLEETESTLPAYGFTDDQGKYQLDVACNTEYHVFEYFSYLINYTESPWLSNTNIANVNGTVNGMESSDNGKTAVLKDTVADRSKPFAYVYNDEDNANKLNLQFFYAGSDWPLSYSFDVVNAQTNAVVGHFSGKLTEGDLTVFQDDIFWSIPVGSVLIDNSLPVPNEFAVWIVKGTITDSKGKQGNLTGFVSAGNLQ